MQAIVGHSFNQSSSGQLRSAYIRRADWLDEREVRRERLVERSETRTKKYVNDSATSSGLPKVRQQVPGPTSSGLPKVRQRVPESDEFRPPKSPAASSGVRRVPAFQKSGSEFRSPTSSGLPSPAASSGVR